MRRASRATPELSERIYPKLGVSTRARNQLRRLAAPPTPPAASRATACAPTRCPSRSWASAPSRRVERRAPAALVVPRELEVVALARHADGDAPDAGPGVEPGAERPEGAVVRRLEEPGEAECCSQESAALVEQALLDDLVRAHQERLRDREAERLRGLEVDDQLELGRLLDRQVGGLGALEDLVHVSGITSEHVEHISAIPESSPVRQNEASVRWQEEIFEGRRRDAIHLPRK